MKISRTQVSPSASFPRLRSLVLGVVLTGGASSCQPEQEAGALAEESGTQRKSLRVANSLTTQALVFNAITTNPLASSQLISGGLQSLFAPLSGNAYLQRQLLDPDAQQVMSYLVSCALGPSSQIQWEDPSSPGTLRTWEGQLGLCPDWKHAAPSAQCKNRVSACLLARNNALGRRVELSLRGEDAMRPALFSMDVVTPPVESDPITDAPVASFAACTAPSSAPTRDCGWTGEGIGRCVPGQPVRLGAGARAPDQCTTGGVLGAASGAPMMLRVCADLAGCDHASARWLDQGQDACGTTQPSVTFTCPASGVFNVSSQAQNSALAGTVFLQVETGTPATTSYPLSEADVFSVREGAYYGNIFDPNSIGANVYVDKEGKIHGKQERIQGSVYRKMYSCQAAGWANTAAYAAHRICALPSSGSNCAAIHTGTCVDPAIPSYPTSRCALSDGPLVPGDMDFEKCRDTTGVAWNEPITVFLHDPCDLSGENQVTCKRNDRRK